MKGKTEVKWEWIIDYLKALAIILVIINHSLPLWARDNWAFFYIVRMAVPIFVLVSGYNFAGSLSRANSLSAWYRPERLVKKMKTYLLPMFGVFVLWLIKGLIFGHITLLEILKRFVLQSYGQGAYYFWIIVQLYLIFPILYYLIKKHGKVGYLIILIINILYELILYFFHISVSVYRIIALRYLMLLAMGNWVYDEVSNADRKETYLLCMLISFILGCLYIAYFSINRERTEIFPYKTWGNTNFFCCLFIVPLFFFSMKFFKNRKIKFTWLHKTLSAIGQSSYYILCTQMIMFWVINRIWTWAGAPLSLCIICNVLFSVTSGILLNYLIDRIKTKIKA